MKNLSRAASLAMIMFIPLTTLVAAPLQWDAGATGGTSFGGTGNWNTSSALWFNATADVAWVNANNDDAIFTGASGTVTLTENISAGDIYFTNVVGNYTVTNATGAEVLTVGNIIDTGGGEHTIGAPVANSGTLNKNGDGRLHLAAANSLGSLMVNQGEVSVENNGAAGSAATVADGAALEFNGSASSILNAVYTTLTINGSGITNSGALRNHSGQTYFYGTISLGENNSVIYSDSGSSLIYDGSGPLTDNGNNYNLIIGGTGSGYFQMGQTSIGGSLIVKGTCNAYLNSISPTVWPSTYVARGATFNVENNNSFGTQPATLMTTNVILDGGTIASGGTYTMYATDGITVTTNNGTLINNSGTWTTCNIYSPSNASVTFGGSGGFHPGGAAGTTAGTINLGTGAIIKNGSGDMNMGYASSSLEIYSNLVLNGGSISFNYDQTSGQVSSLGAVPTTLNQSNIVFNGGSIHAGHSTTIAATRGIFVASGGGTIEDVTSGGTVTIAGPISGPGNMNFPLGKSGSTTAVVLSGNNTYTGTTTVGASCTVTVGSGSTTGALGTGNTAVSGTLTFNRTGSYSYGGAISGSGVVNKNASGIVTFTGINTYSGATTINGGTLLINGTNGAGAISVASGAALGGNGLINGPVTVNAGGILALGGGTLSVNNSVSIVGNVSVSLNKSLTQSNGTAAVSGTLANTGTGSIIVTNLGPALAVGDTFHLFNQAVTGAGSMPVTGGDAGVTWNNNLAVDGTISVLSATVPKPVINQVQISGGNFIFSGTNGSGTYYVLSSTNMTLPLSQWSYVSTNSFNGNGQFFITNPVGSGNSQQFYLLKTP